MLAPLDDGGSPEVEFGTPPPAPTPPMGGARAAPATAAGGPRISPSPTAAPQSPQLRFGSEARLTPLPPAAVDTHHHGLLAQHEQVVAAMAEAHRAHSGGAAASPSFGHHGERVVPWLELLTKQSHHTRELLRLHKRMLGAAYDVVRDHEREVPTLPQAPLEQLKHAIREATAAVEYDGDTVQVLRDRVVELEDENMRLEQALARQERTAAQCAAAFAQYDAMNRELMERAKGQQPRA